MQTTPRGKASAVSTVNDVSDTTSLAGVVSLLVSGEFQVTAHIHRSEYASVYSLYNERYVFFFS